MTTISGKAWRLGDHVSTDEILPGRYMALTDRVELAEHVLEGIRPNFAATINPGDILVAGRNFGTGSSRQQAPAAIIAAGFAAIVAESFARIFFRNCINTGLPVFWSPTVPAATKDGDQISIETERGLISNHTSGTQDEISPLPLLVASIVTAGGLVPYARARLGGSLIDD